MNNKIILYSTHCPACKALTMKLQKFKVDYTEFTDVDAMIDLGITAVPVLEVNGTRMKMKDAIKWLEENYGRQS